MTSLREVVDGLRTRLTKAGIRHTGDIPAADCLLYAEASNALGQLVDALESQPETLVDWRGLALELEAQAKRVESKSAMRAMYSAARGLRLMGAKENQRG